MPPDALVINGSEARGQEEPLQGISKGALRMRRLRERRANRWTRVMRLEISAQDALALRRHGFLEDGESAKTDIPLALRRLLASLREDGQPPES